MRNPKTLMIVGTLLMVLGVILPLLMVIKMIESTFLLSFISYAASLAGMVMAFVGMFTYITFRRK